MFSKVQEKKNRFALSSLYKAFNLVVMEVLILEFPHKMWRFIEMARMELRTTVFDAGSAPPLLCTSGCGLWQAPSRTESVLPGMWRAVVAFRCSGRPRGLLLTWPLCPQWTVWSWDPQTALQGMFPWWSLPLHWSWCVPQCPFLFNLSF